MNTIIGITERGDAGIDFSWTEKIDKTAYSVIITKNTTSERFHKECLKHKDKILLHATITGWGGTEMEPNVPNPIESIKSVCKLIHEGFPPEQVVWRIDPIIAVNGDQGFKKAQLVFHNIRHNLHLHHCNRIRVSVFDNYKHAKQRMSNIGMQADYDGFVADKESFAKINKLIAYWQACGFIVETCAEPKLKARHIGCVNDEDAKLFGVNIVLHSKNKQNRFGCLCSTAKTELLCNRRQCPHGCAYCYWK